MRASLFILFIYLCPTLGIAAPKTWNGTVGTWSIASNWLPAGMPGANDDIIINTGFPITIYIDVAGPFPLNSITITNNTPVVFDCMGTRNFILQSVSALSPALKIESGSSLIIDGSNAGTNNSTLLLTGGAGVIASIYGQLIFSSSGGARTGASIHLDTYTGPSNYGLLTVYSGGSIQIRPDAGNTATTLIPVPNITMKDGSVYEISKNGGSFPAGRWEVHSLAKAAGPGSNGPVFNGSVYGNMEWNCPNQTVAAFLNENVSFNNVLLLNTGSNHTNGEFRVKTGTSAGVWTMTINGDLTVQPDARILTSSLNTTVGNGGRIFIKGNINNMGTITSMGLPGTVNELLIAGSTAQSFSNTGIFSGSQLLFIMQNPSGLDLLTPLTFPGNAVFTNGKIRTNASSILSMIDNAVYSGGSVNSFVDGPMRKIGDDDFIFPVGKGGIYAPVGIKSVSGQQLSDIFTAEYKRANPQGIFGANFQPGINHISYVEYWTLDCNNGSAIKNLLLDVHATSFCKVLTNTFVTRFNGSLWTPEGGIITNGPIISGAYQIGTLMTANQISGFNSTAFTLATDLSTSMNPLPIGLASFDARKLSLTTSILTWKLESICPADTEFELQRAGANNVFHTIGAINAKLLDVFYDYTDNDLQRGINYYRLKIKEGRGKLTYSQVIVVMNERDELSLFSVFPSEDKLCVSIRALKNQQLYLLITDMQGRLVQRSHHSVVAGTNIVQVSLIKLPAGIYQVWGIGRDGRTNVLGFLK